ncbi:MAG: YjfB family protein [Polyangiales bacterium]
MPLAASAQVGAIVLKSAPLSADGMFMDISGIASLATQMSRQRTAETAQLLVLKKAMSVQESGALQLIASAASAGSLPSHLGQNVNTVA